MAHIKQRPPKRPCALPRNDRGDINQNEQWVNDLGTIVSCIQWVTCIKSSLFPKQSVCACPNLSKNIHLNFLFLYSLRCPTIISGQKLGLINPKTTNTLLSSGSTTSFTDIHFITFPYSPQWTPCIMSM